MKPVLLLAACLLAAPCAAEDTLFHVSLVAFNAVEGADLATTMARQQGVEGNPLMVGLVAHPFTVGIVKMGTVGLLTWGLSVLHRTHPKLAFSLALAGT